MNGFIEDIITINIDHSNWVEHNKNTPLLEIHTKFRPLQSSEPLKRDYPLSIHKLSGEGQIAKRKTCLGWDIQTQYLWLSPPKKNIETGYSTSGHPYP